MTQMLGNSVSSLLLLTTTGKSIWMVYLYTW